MATTTALEKEWDLRSCVLPELKVYAVVVINVGRL